MRSRICVSIIEKGAEACLEALRDEEFAEIRLDLCQLDEAGITKVFSMGKALIATCPPAFGTETERKALLLKAITSGARFVDIDLDSTYAFRKELMDAARRSGCKVITSYHDHEKTPDRKELGRIAERCNLVGGDIVKIACMVKGPQDCARLLSLLDGGSRMVVIGMGPLGRITRVAGPLLGGEFTFASLKAGRESAPGQMSRKEIEAVWEAIEGGRMGGGSA